MRMFRADFLQVEGPEPDSEPGPVGTSFPSFSRVVGGTGEGRGNESLSEVGNSLNTFFPAEGAGNNFSAEP